ncbi:recombinase family protein [Amycolatopsis sp., V23-08]|uniref:Recombinase family protein n=1 Tax=Amycolatopsis heterodermiae TaxID=3110235 RepID=A0ABU5RBM1_9PSEU|nr:recombinase family protein [Amycolatopsis sp., V23-08]MEA5363010.1 recombinase family protein [Amycolatopsis sp., V23-08]
MDLTPDQAASAAEQLDCPTCGVPAGSPCRNRSGTTALKYHTPRFLLIPALRDAHEVDVPDDRGPGRPWQGGPARTTGEAGTPIRIGYACCSPASPDLDRQLGALTTARCDHVFAEQVGARIKTRAELEKALAIGSTRAAPGRTVILTVHELKRLARTTAELITVSAEVEAAGLELEVLTGPLAGIHDPNGPGQTLFAVLAAAAHLDRDHVREKTREGQQAATAKGHRSGRPKALDEEMLALARRLHGQGVSVPDIARQLTIRTGKNAGRHPSVASVYRALAEPVASHPDHPAPVR